MRIYQNFFELIDYNGEYALKIQKSENILS